jgi:hypothetical protein
MDMYNYIDFEDVLSDTDYIEDYGYCIEELDYIDRMSVEDFDNFDTE